MPNSKTHFAQVPLEVVRKIVEEQTDVNSETESCQGIDKEMLSEVLLEAEVKSIAPLVALARAESSN